MPSHPVRTCVGCRQRAAKQELLRVVAQGTDGSRRLVADPGAREQGRGAYLHPTRECLDQALRRRAFGRALRVPAPLDAAGLESHLDGAQHAQISTTDSVRQRWSSSS